jgi:hypothetical protein
MTPHMRHCLRKELVSRGFTPSGESPNGTMALDDAYLDDMDVGELLDTMVVRRKKMFLV